MAVPGSPTHTTAQPFGISQSSPESHLDTPDHQQDAGDRRHAAWLSANLDKHTSNSLAKPMHPMASMADQVLEPLPAALILEHEPYHTEHDQPIHVAQNMADLLRMCSRALSKEAPGVPSHHSSLLQGAITNGQSPAEALLQAQQHHSPLQGRRYDQASIGPSHTGRFQNLKSKLTEGLARALGLSHEDKAAKRHQGVRVPGSGSLAEENKISHGKGENIQRMETSASTKLHATHGSFAWRAKGSSPRAGKNRIIRATSSTANGSLSRGPMSIGSGKKKFIFIQPSPDAGSTSAESAADHRGIQRELQGPGSPLQISSRIAGAGQPRRGTQLAAKMSVPVSQAPSTLFHAHSRLQGSEALRRGGNLMVLGRSNSVEAADAAAHHTSSRHPSNMRPDTSRRSLRHAPLVIQASGLDYAGSQGPESEASAASTLGFWAFASHLRGDPQPHEAQPIPSTASSIGFWALASQLIGHHKSMGVLPQASSVVRRKGAHPQMQIQEQGSQRINAGVPTPNLRPTTASVRSGRAAKRSVIVVQSSCPSEAEQTSQQSLSRKSSRSSTSGSSSASRRGDILQVGRSGSVIAADTASPPLSGLSGLSRRSRHQEVLQVRHTDAARQEDSVNSRTGSSSSSGRSRRLDILQVPSSNEAFSSELSQGSSLGSRLSSRSSRRTRHLEAKPGMARNRRNFGDLVQTNSESTLAESIRNHP
jgi:hypothetical protein